MLVHVHRLRCWPKIEPTLAQLMSRVIAAGVLHGLNTATDNFHYIL